jgi:hypothetical protein
MGVHKHSNTSHLDVQETYAAAGFGVVSMSAADVSSRYLFLTL